MAPLSELIDYRTLHAEDDEEDDDDTELEEDLSEALKLLNECLDELEEVEKLDKSRKFLTTRGRKRVSALTIDLLTFLGQWEHEGLERTP